MDHTGANVYKGMVGLYPIYDPKDYSGDPAYPGALPGGLDNGNEKEGLQLPGCLPSTATGIRRSSTTSRWPSSTARLDDGVTSTTTSTTTSTWT